MSYDLIMNRLKVSIAQVLSFPAVSGVTRLGFHAWLKLDILMIFSRCLSSGVMYFSSIHTLRTHGYHNAVTNTLHIIYPFFC